MFEKGLVSSWTAPPCESSQCHNWYFERNGPFQYCQAKEISSTNRKEKLTVENRLSSLLFWVVKVTFNLFSVFFSSCIVFCSTVIAFLIKASFWLSLPNSCFKPSAVPFITTCDGGGSCGVLFGVLFGVVSVKKKEIKDGIHGNKMTKKYLLTKDNQQRIEYPKCHWNKYVIWCGFNLISFNERKGKTLTKYYAFD